MGDRDEWLECFSILYGNRLHRFNGVLTYTISARQEISWLIQLYFVSTNGLCLQVACSNKSAISPRKGNENIKVSNENDPQCTTSIYRNTFVVAGSTMILS